MHMYMEIGDAGNTQQCGEWNQKSKMKSVYGNLFLLTWNVTAWALYRLNTISRYQSKLSVSIHIICRGKEWYYAE
jgi:hypothetical protein